MNFSGAKKDLPWTGVAPSRVRQAAVMSWMALALFEMGCGNASTSTSQVERMGATQTPSLTTRTPPASTLEAPEHSNLDKEPRRECPMGQHRLARFEGCVPVSLEGDYAAKSVDVGVLAPIQPAKLAALMDIEALRASIRPFTSLDPSRGEALCSLFQTGEKNLRPADVRWLKGIADRDPEIEGRYLALTLAAILTGRAASTTVNAVLHAIEGRMTRAMDRTPPDLKSVRRMLANYLMTSHVFGAKQQTPAVQRATKLLFPTTKLQVPETLHLGFLEEVVIARLSGWPIVSGDVRRMIERSRLPSPTGKGHVTFSDCTERICRYKAYQTVMSLDQLIGIWTPKERQEHLDAILGKIERKALFGHVRDYGLVPADLWERSRCDYFCSVKHWTVLVTLNHLLHAERAHPSTPTEATQREKDQQN